MNQPAQPVINIRQYQRAFFDDDSQFILWLKSRQIGGSFAGTLKAIDIAFETGEDWIFMSRGLRQAKRLLLKAAKHVRAMNEWRMGKYGAPDIVEEIGTEQIKLRNGSTIMAMPCDDETSIGDAANVLLDEFPLYPNSNEILDAITPCIMNGFRIIAIGTPRGRKGAFPRLYLDEGNGWSKHHTTIYEAERGGLRLKRPDGSYITADDFLNTLRRNGMTEKGIQQEFLCEFLDEASAFLTLDMLYSIADPVLTTAIDWKALATPGRTFYVGVDIGRYRDLTVIWIWELVDSKLVCRGMKIFEDTPFWIQEAELDQVMKHPTVRRCGIDSTGIGTQFTENMQRKYFDRVERVVFTEQRKAELANSLRIWAEQGKLAIPRDDTIIADFHSIEKSASLKTGTIRYTSSRTSIGHADRFWAAAIGVDLAGGYQPFELVMAFAS